MHPVNGYVLAPALVCGSGFLGGDQFVDFGAKILQHEIFFGRNLAVIDFLRPLFKRNLDAECLVDGENDIEEIQTVDAKIDELVAAKKA